MFDSEPDRLLPPELQWTTVAPEKGQSLRGWVVGPLVRVTCHFVGDASRPCRDKLTKGQVLCYCLKEPVSARQLGYMPIMTKEREKLVVLMCATTARKAETFVQGTAVEFWRPNKNNTGLGVKMILADELGAITTQNVQRHKPWDIKPYLLQVLWQDKVLVDYFAKAPVALGAPAIAPPPEPVGKKTKSPKKGGLKGAPLVSHVAPDAVSVPDSF